jgi:hypothetical protein
MLVGFPLAVYLLIKEAKQSANTSAAEAVFARFSFTEQEWEIVHRTEFIEDEKGKSFLNRYAGVVLYEYVAKGDSRKEIVFSPQKIQLSDGKNVKTYIVNRLNSFGNGIHLSSIDLLHLSPLRKLRIKVTADSVNESLNKIDFDLEYLISLPQSAHEQIDELLKTYDKIIRES